MRRTLRLCRGEGEGGMGDIKKAEEGVQKIFQKKGEGMEGETGGEAGGKQDL